MSLKTIFIILSAVWYLTGCGPRQDVAEWTEEVILHDGRSITVWRRAVAKRGGFPEPRGANLEFELKYEPMGVYWKSDPKQLLMGFDVIDGVAWMVLYHEDRALCRQMHPMDTRAQYYRWHQGQWQAVALREAPADVVRHNLWGDFWGREPKNDAKGHIPWSKKTGGGLITPPQSAKDWLTANNRFCKYLN